MEHGSVRVPEGEGGSAPLERAMIITDEDRVLIVEGVRKATSRDGWTVQPIRIFTRGMGLRIENGPGRRGIKRDTFLIVGPVLSESKDPVTLAAAFRALADVLELIDR